MVVPGDPITSNKCPTIGTEGGWGISSKHFQNRLRFFNEITTSIENKTKSIGNIFTTV